MMRARVVCDLTTVSNLIIGAKSAIINCLFARNAVVSSIVVSLNRRRRLMRLVDTVMHILGAIRISHDTHAAAAVIAVADIYYWYIELGLRVMLLMRRRR